jgi:hypothetical protein
VTSKSPREHDDDRDPAAVAEAWAVMAAARLSPSSDELALMATWEAMRLMLLSDTEAVQRRARDAMRSLLAIMLGALRDHDPGAMERLVEQWRPAAESMGLEW